MITGLLTNSFNLEDPEKCLVEFIAMDKHSLLSSFSFPHILCTVGTYINTAQTKSHSSEICHTIVLAFNHLYMLLDSLPKESLTQESLHTQDLVLGTQKCLELGLSWKSDTRLVNSIWKLLIRILLSFSPFLSHTLPLNNIVQAIIQLINEKQIELMDFLEHPDKYPQSSLEPILAHLRFHMSHFIHLTRNEHWKSKLNTIHISLLKSIFTVSTMLLSPWFQNRITLFYSGDQEKINKLLEKVEMFKTGIHVLESIHPSPLSQIFSLFVQDESKYVSGKLLIHILNLGINPFEHIPPCPDKSAAFGLLIDRLVMDSTLYEEAIDALKTYCFRNRTPNIFLETIVSRLLTKDSFGYLFLCSNVLLGWASRLDSNTALMLVQVLVRNLGCVLNKYGQGNLFYFHLSLTRHFLYILLKTNRLGTNMMVLVDKFREHRDSISTMMFCLSIPFSIVGTKILDLIESIIDHWISVLSKIETITPKEGFFWRVVLDLLMQYFSQSKYTTRKQIQIKELARIIDGITLNRMSNDRELMDKLLGLLVICSKYFTYSQNISHLEKFATLVHGAAESPFSTNLLLMYIATICSGKVTGHDSSRINVEVQKMTRKLVPVSSNEVLECMILQKLDRLVRNSGMDILGMIPDGDIWKERLKMYMEDLEQTRSDQSQRLLAARIGIEMETMNMCEEILSRQKEKVWDRDHLVGCVETINRFISEAKSKQNSDDIAWIRSLLNLGNG